MLLSTTVVTGLAHISQVMAYTSFIGFSRARAGSEALVRMFSLDTVGNQSITEARTAFWKEWR